MLSEREADGVFRDLLDSDPEHGVVLLSGDRHVVYSNSAARSYLRDGTPRSAEGLLPETVDRVLEGFVRRATTQRGPASTEFYYPSESDRQVKISLEAVSRDDGPYVVLRAHSTTPWAEPTVRRLQSRFGLTVREAQVAAGVARGHTNAEVAGQLGIVEKTVKNVLMSVFNKCSVRNRVELALRAYDAPVPRLTDREAERAASRAAAR
ncbi:MAG: LuxR C-terminal-related transcriptional regulator [Planctomycetota bacterium]